ncbi:MAG: hypothetical protein U0746_07135 [Gemmataceae bacterium]
MAADDTTSANLRLALRIAASATICLFLSELFKMNQPSLSVFTCHLSMVLFPYSAFQKMLERLGGRVLGVSYGLTLVAFLNDAPFLLLALMLLGQIFFFYVNASGRLAYASLMGGLFVGVIVEIGIASSPVAAQDYAVGLIEQLVLATFVIFHVNWFTGAERSLAIETRGEPLLPLRAGWLSKSGMVSTGQVVSMMTAVWFGLPVLPTMISATLLAVTTTDAVAMGEKALERAAGAVLGGTYAMACMVVLAYIPEFSLLLALVFYGMFLAAYFTKANARFTYTFMQAGLVLPLVLIGTSGEVGNIGTMIGRLFGVATGLTLAEVIFLCWPWPMVTTPPPPSRSAEVVQPGH